MINYALGCESALREFLRNFDLNIGSLYKDATVKRRIYKLARVKNQFNFSIKSVFFKEQKSCTCNLNLRINYPTAKMNDFLTSLSDWQVFWQCVKKNNINFRHYLENVLLKIKLYRSKNIDTLPLHNWQPNNI